MPYFLNNADDQRAMLASIGVESIDELFAMVPPELRLGRPLDVPPALGELELTAHLSALAARNDLGRAGRLLSRRRQLRPFHSGGRRFRRLAQRIYHVLHALPGRSQPGQPPGPLRVPDADHAIDRHGRVQFQPLRRRQRGGRGGAHGHERHAARPGRVLIARSVHPEYRQILATYLANLDVELVTLDTPDGGVSIRRPCEAAVNDQTACVLLQHPNFFGCVEEMETLAGDRPSPRGAVGRQRRSDQPGTAQAAGRLRAPTSSWPKGNRWAPRCRSAGRTWASWPAASSSSAACRADWSARPSIAAAGAAGC